MSKGESVKDSGRALEAMVKVGLKYNRKRATEGFKKEECPSGIYV
jgi:hypothetical protein